MTLEFILNKQIIRRTDEETPVAGSVNYLKAHFLFSDEWNGTKTIIFKAEDDNITPQMVILEGDECDIPPVVLKGSFFKVSAFCGDLVTANEIAVDLIPTGYVEGETPEEPTPSVYEQLVDMVQSVRNDAEQGNFNGATFTPTISEEGDLSWTNDKGLDNPTTVNIKGPRTLYTPASEYVSFRDIPNGVYDVSADFILIGDEEKGQRLEVHKGDILSIEYQGSTDNWSFISLLCVRGVYAFQSHTENWEEMGLLVNFNCLISVIQPIENKYNELIKITKNINDALNETKESIPTDNADLENGAGYQTEVEVKELIENSADKWELICDKTITDDDGEISALDVPLDKKYTQFKVYFQVHPIGITGNTQINIGIAVDNGSINSTLIFPNSSVTVAPYRKVVGIFNCKPPYAMWSGCYSYSDAGFGFYSLSATQNSSLVYGNSKISDESKVTAIRIALSNSALIASGSRLIIYGSREGITDESA